MYQTDSKIVTQNPALYHAFECLSQQAAPTIVETGGETSLCADWARNHSNCTFFSVADDSESFFRTLNRPIDFLYLHRSKCFDEIAAAYPLLAKDALVMIDGNEASVIEALLKQGYKIILRKDQTLLSKVNIDAENIAYFSRSYELKYFGAFYDEASKTMEGSSGSGSEPKHSQFYLDFLQNFIRKNQIQSVVDIGCGDWQLSRRIDWHGVDYLGLDIVPALISHHNKHFSAPNIQFWQADGTRIELPPADLVICKDILQHISHSDILRFFKQLSKYKYALLTNDTDRHSLSSNNSDTGAGGYRTLDLSKAPFYLRGEKVAHYTCPTGETKLLYLWTRE